MSYLKRARARAVSRLMPSPVRVRHAEYSMILSADDDVSAPSETLIETACEAIQHARHLSLDEISARMPSGPYYPNVWPGEHYKLLAGLVATVQPRLVIEIGTATGLSALSMKRHLPEAARLVTFDLVGWEAYPGGLLRHEDFADGQLVQQTDDLSDPIVASRNAGLLGHADLIFIDAAKDGVMEQRFIDNLKAITFEKPPLVVFDDIRVWNMLRVWRGISFPKMDLTSFGHWSGTGLVDWQTT